MCGRFAQIREEEELMKSLSVHHCEVSVETSYNIAPGADIPLFINRMADVCWIQEGGV